MALAHGTQNMTEEVEYTDFRVMADGLPTGLWVKAENEIEGLRQLAIGVSRLDIPDIDLELVAED